MFKNEVVIITGAGASKHYGYPTGAELLNLTVSLAKSFLKFYNICHSNGFSDCPRYIFDKFKRNAPLIHSLGHYLKAAEECEDFIKRMSDGEPPVIDYFLGQNLHLADFGKFLIAWVILFCEKNDAVEQNWVRYIVSVLCADCTESQQLLLNNVHFGTFNYDTSLERYLRKGLSARSLFLPEHIQEFLSGDRIFHIYGAVNSGTESALNIGADISNQDPFKTLHASISLIDKVWEMSQNIQVIDPKSKHPDEDGLKGLVGRIATAKRLFILGFGFDTQNVEVLNFRELNKQGPNGPARTAYLTNFNDTAAVNQRASRALFGNTIDPLNGFGSSALKAYKSYKDVNNALSLDFILEDA